MPDRLRGAHLNGPDGPEEREADNAEYFDREEDRIDAIEDRADVDVDAALMDIAQAKMMNWALDRVFA